MSDITGPGSSLAIMRLLKGKPAARVLNFPPPDPFVALARELTADLHTFTREILEEVESARHMAAKLAPLPPLAKVYGGNVTPLRKGRAA